MNQPLTQYLNSGHQTEITPEIEKIASSFGRKGFDLIFEILDWLHKNLKVENNQKIKSKIFRKRTAQEIIESGFVTGCTDRALVFIVLARVKKIPTKYVETIRRRWLDKGKENLIEGHIFVEVYLNKHWYIIDPEEAAIKAWYDRWIVFKKGLDSWDIRIRNLKNLKEQFLEFRKKYQKDEKALKFKQY